jgi:hypothetical protein
MTTEQLHAFFIGHGYIPNRWGAYQKPLLPGVRYKIKKLVLRKERQLSDGGWFRVSSGYLAHLELTPDGKLKGLSQ